MVANKIIKCRWIYLDGGKIEIEYPYEILECEKFKSIEKLNLKGK